MTEVAIVSAIEKLEKLLAVKGHFLHGEQKQVRGLNDDLKTTSSLLNQLEDDRYALTSLAEIAHDANHTIDAFISGIENSTNSSRGGTQRRLYAISSLHLSRLGELGKKIKSIQNRMAALRIDRVYHYLFKAGETRRRSSTSVGPPRIREGEVVGLEEDVKFLVNEANFQRTHQFSTLFILGMGGIGKTTLASLLYSRAEVARQFEICAWVYVSAEFSVKKVISDLFRELGSEDMPEMMMKMMDEDDLLGIIYKHLVGKKYFVVLDDVLSAKHLESVLPAFPPRGGGSRLVVTSRSRYDVRTGSADYIHEMKILDPSKSWELFLKKAFGNNRRCPKHLERIGKQIVKRCDGLPLAIREAGTKLFDKTQSELVWKEFLESMDLSETSASLELSYQRLPAPLKPCFLSFVFFKEGITIRANKLVQIWVAGGMVSQQNKRSETDETIGRRDLDTLIGQFLVQVKDWTRDYDVKNCDINYNLHRLALAKANEEMMFEVMTKERSSYPSSHNPPHRAICCSREKFSYSTNQDKDLISLFFQGGGYFDSNPSYWKSLESLKILDFEDFGLKIFPVVTGTLVTLKFLGLRNNFIQELPCSLGQLEKLEVLDIAQNFMVEVPNIIWKMDCLRHIYMSGVICPKPLKIEKLHNLRTLTYISVDNWTYEVSNLKMMLHKLGIEELDGNSCVSKLFASLAKLGRLEFLILRGFRFRSMPELHELHILQGLKRLKLDGLLTRLPSANDFPPNIEYLCLANSCLNEDPIPTLEELPKLHHLVLRNAFDGEHMAISRRGFPELYFLFIEELWHLRSVQVGEGALQRLRQLEIISCPYLRTLPKEIGVMSYLEELKIVTTKDIAALLRDSSFISNIQKVEILP